jgi:hypothetical protein
MRRSSSIRRSIVTAQLFLAACAGGLAVPRHPAAQLQCAAASFPINEQIGPWSVDKFAGVYLRGADRLTVRRDGHRLLAEGWVLGTRELTAASIESWTWRDGCGVRYEFTLPPDGPGAWLKVFMPDGTSTDWHR